MTSKTDISVAKLVDMIKTGELTLPEMQRGYVWKADRVRDLLDSLYRGYPSGTILVWETDREVPSREMAIRQGSSPFKGHKLLLDGQQRLTSLASILRGEPVKVRGSRKPIELLFNLDHPEGAPTDEPDDEPDTDETEDEPENSTIEEPASKPTSSPVHERTRKLAFAKASRALLASPTWIRVSDIFSEKSEPEILHRALPGGWENPNYKKYTERVQRVRRIRDYTYVMQVLERTMEYEEVAEIFVRVNSSGVKLRSSDLALAQITSRWRDSLRLFEEFRASCNNSIDVGFIVRTLVVFATGQSRFKIVGSLHRAKLESSWDITKKNICWALEYLRSLNIETSLLSSTFLVIALAYYHEFHPTLSAPESQKLRRWLLHANARGRYSRGSTETFLDSDLAQIRAGRGPSTLLEALQQQTGRLEFTARELANTSVLSPILSTVFLAVRARGALDLQRGTPLSLPENRRSRLNNWHYAFPKAPDLENARRKELANVVFLSVPKRGKKSIGPVEKWGPKALSAHGEEAFRAHGLPTNRHYYDPSSFLSFAEFRRDALATILNEFIDGSKERGISASRIEQLVDGGENSATEFKQRAIGNDGKVIEYVCRGIAAFLNSSGGTFLIGIDDDGEVIGIEQDIARLKKPNEDSYQLAINGHLLQSLGESNAGMYNTTITTYRDKKICVIEVAHSPISVYTKRKGGAPEFFIRAGNQVRRLEGKDIEDYQKNRKRP